MLGKHFTAAAVLRLVEAGRIGLDDSIGTHLRDVPASLAPLKLRDMLGHVSGAPDVSGVGNRAVIAYDRPLSRAKFLELLGTLPVDFAPREAFHYSNTGFVLLGFLLADLTGRPYGTVIQEELLRRAKLQDSRPDDGPAIIADRSEAYVMGKTGLQHGIVMDRDYSNNGAGGVLLSGRDMAQWEIAMQAGSAIPVAAQGKMRQPGSFTTGRSTGYGFGWFLDHIHGRDVAYHSGNIPGFISFYFRVPSEQVGAFVSCNLGATSGAIAMIRLVQELVEHALPGSTGLSLQPIGDDDKALTDEARAMIMRGDKTLDASRFAPEIAVLLGNPTTQRSGPPDRSDRALQSFELVETVPEGDGQVRRYRATFAEMTEHLAFAYAKDGKIFRIRSI